jgi:hypothetical protein
LLNRCVYVIESDQTVCHGIRSLFLAVPTMEEYPSGQTNHPAVAGFLIPFAAAGVAASLVLFIQGKVWTLMFMVPYLTVVPGLLLAGLFLSIRSIPLIPERNDKDYAYSGLTLNLLFLFIYLLSLFYYLF